VPAVMAAMWPVTVPATALEPSAPAVTAAVPTAIPAIRPSAPVASTESSVIAIPSAALRPLETRTRVAADAREILAGRSGFMRTTCLARQKNRVIFNRGFDRRTRRRCCGQRFRFHVFDGFFVSEVGALGFCQFDVLSFLVRCFALFVVTFLMSRFGGELFLVCFLLRLFALVMLVLVVFFFLVVMVAVLFAFRNLVRLV